MKVNSCLIEILFLFIGFSFRPLYDRYIDTRSFGEHTQQYSDGNVLFSDLHDCGIIYHPEHPYFLCVMTQGPSIEMLEGVIARISEKVFDFVDSPSYPSIIQRVSPPPEGIGVKLRDIWDYGNLQ